jgi:hypothetical protein
MMHKDDGFAQKMTKPPDGGRDRLFRQKALFYISFTAGLGTIAEQGMRRMNF